MTRDQAIAELAAHADALRARGVAAAYLFGSTARGEARPDSDLDVFVDVRPGAKFSLLDLIGVKHFLEDELGREVDLTTRGGLHPLLKAEIEREAVRVL
jgi:predicted nucleotidyltransferase